MATKKKAAKKSTAKALVLKWNPRWIADPPPLFFKQLDRETIRELAQAKTNFVTQVKTILQKGQR